jgi:hypothetical protein
VVVKSTVFWDIVPRSPLSVNRSLGGTYRLHLLGLILFSVCILRIHICLSVGIIEFFVTLFLSLPKNVYFLESEFALFILKRLRREIPFEVAARSGYIV